ncbi:hypothetical protein [Streptomyces sp. NPDC086182]|uniref:hypothetical protein n=1 Tax=Streptomyces sp. NPDC086182 TaxID=3155058 RepID=UPI0034294EBA
MNGWHPDHTSGIRRAIAGVHGFVDPGRDGLRVGVGVAAADPALELKNFRDDMVELPSLGVPVFDDVEGVPLRRESVVGWLELGVERVGDFTQSAGVGGVIRHESCSGRSG